VFTSFSVCPHSFSCIVCRTKRLYIKQGPISPYNYSKTCPSETDTPDWGVLAACLSPNKWFVEVRNCSLKLKMLCTTPIAMLLLRSFKTVGQTHQPPHEADPKLWCCAFKPKQTRQLVGCPQSSILFPRKFHLHLLSFPLAHMISTHHTTTAGNSIAWSVCYSHSKANHNNNSADTIMLKTFLQPM